MARTPASKGLTTSSWNIVPQDPTALKGKIPQMTHCAPLRNLPTYRA